ncbi:hypothetical protein BN971_01873 [Mycobacterium bohemicum DSM 44277]|uniref:Uncharacterized protein n=2 Tax=Mycobacterium bohemicum TaxID=56425 RepID=A0A1X1QWL9_MYCBE|nr:hypothetical protein [Mycobacterium bohemicum]MCV6970082.1 hypothetical protein [Mycobacterium bohemicum]ORU95790.1 hypothetical protein AWB93_22700 [Mycobacterium bohemicum]CPR10477.1 hypothetical protein BN971_01873 [Mycobacterium bohemicum DSM 44277]
MKLYDQAVDLQLKLEAAQSADSGIELVTKADHLVEALDNATGYLTGLLRLRSRLSLTEALTIDAKASAAAVSAFRAGLSRYGPKAFQQQPATKLIEVARDQRTRAARWAGARWRSIFEGYQQLLEQTQPGRLFGGTRQRFAAERIATKLLMLQRQDPIADEDKIIAELCDGDSSASWLERVKSLGDDLARALQSLEDERASLASEVQEALELATSEDGLPLTEVTASLLDALHAAGVDGDLVVRRR